MILLKSKCILNAFIIMIQMAHYFDFLLFTPPIVGCNKAASLGIGLNMGIRNTVRVSVSALGVFITSMPLLLSTALSSNYSASVDIVESIAVMESSPLHFGNFASMDSTSDYEVTANGDSSGSSTQLGTPSAGEITIENPPSTSMNITVESTSTTPYLTPTEINAEYDQSAYTESDSLSIQNVTPENNQSTLKLVSSVEISEEDYTEPELSLSYHITISYD